MYLGHTNPFQKGITKERPKKKKEQPEMPNYINLENWD